MSYIWVNWKGVKWVSYDGSEIGLGWLGKYMYNIYTIVDLVYIIHLGISECNS